MPSQLPTPKVLGWPSRSLHRPLLQALLRGPQLVSCLPSWQWLWALAEKSAPSVLAFPATETLVSSFSPQRPLPAAFSFTLLQEVSLYRIIPCSPTSSWNHQTPFLPISSGCYLVLSAAVPVFFWCPVTSQLAESRLELLFILNVSLPIPGHRHLSGMTAIASIWSVLVPAKPAAISFRPLVVFSCPGASPVQDSELSEGQDCDMYTSV